MKTKHIKEVETFSVKIYLSGPIEVAKQLLRQECLRQGLCVTVEPTQYIYTGGEESGYVVGMVNYPRFPSSPQALTDRAKEIASFLIEGTHQHSALVMTPVSTFWLTTRDA